MSELDMLIQTVDSFGKHRCKWIPILPFHTLLYTSGEQSVSCSSDSSTFAWRLHFRSSAQTAEQTGNNETRSRTTERLNQSSQLSRSLTHISPRLTLRPFCYYLLELWGLARAWALSWTLAFTVLTLRVRWLCRVDNRKQNFHRKAVILPATVRPGYDQSNKYRNLPNFLLGLC